MIIDTHAHMVPRSLFEAVKSAARDFPSVAMAAAGTSYQFAFAGGKPTRPVFPKLLDPEQRVAWMKGNGITHQIVGGWLDVFGYELPAQEGLRWSRLFNEHLLATTKATGGFVPLATVPLQEGALAAQVLAEALDAGFPGVMIGTQPKGMGGTLDDPALDPFWEVASKRGAVVYIHPMYVCGDDRLADYDTVLLDPATLRFMVEKVGVGRVMLGSDYPFPIGDPEPCKVVNNAGFSEIDLRAILGGTAAKLFQVSGCGCGA